jgi:hypothetical protein
VSKALQTHFNQPNFFPTFFHVSHSGPGRNGFVEGSLMEMEEENEDQWDPFEDEDLFIGEEESEEF